MNDLFIRLYLDEDVDALVAKLIRSRGFFIQTTAEASRHGTSDASQLAYATENRMAIVTHNRVDFDRLAREYASTGKSHDGMIISVRRRPQDIARRLLTLLDQVTADDMRKQVRYI